MWEIELALVNCLLGENRERHKQYIHYLNYVSTSFVFLNQCCLYACLPWLSSYLLRIVIRLCIISLRNSLCMLFTVSISMQHSPGYYLWTTSLVISTTLVPPSKRSACMCVNLHGSVIAGCGDVFALSTQQIHLCNWLMFTRFSLLYFLMMETGPRFAMTMYGLSHLKSTFLYLLKKVIEIDVQCTIN